AGDAFRAVSLDEVAAAGRAGDRVHARRRLPVTEPRVPLPAEQTGADRRRGPRRLRVEAGVAEDRVLPLRGADDERERLVAVVADVHLPQQRVLRLSERPPGRRRDAARVGAARLDALVTDLHAVRAAVGPVLETDLPV